VPDQHGRAHADDLGEDPTQATHILPLRELRTDEQLCEPILELRAGVVVQHLQASDVEPRRLGYRADQLAVPEGEVEGSSDPLSDLVGAGAFQRGRSGFRSSGSLPSRGSDAVGASPTQMQGI